MNKITPSKSGRSGASPRLVVLLLVLVIIGAGCAYEFAVARPTFQKAWDQVRAVDESASSSEYTAEQIEEMMGQPPANVDENLHKDCVVKTWRWRSGLVVKNHDIHVVFTKIRESIVKNRPELKGKLYYYSAAAGQPLDLNANFPKEKQTIVVNLNPPMVSLGGGPPPSAAASETSEDDNKEEESTEDNTESEDEAAKGEDKTEGDDKAKGDDKAESEVSEGSSSKSEAKPSEEKPAEESAEKNAEKAEKAGESSEEPSNDDKKQEEKSSDEKEGDDS